MDTGVAAQLRMEGGDELVPLAGSDDVAVDSDQSAGTSINLIERRIRPAQVPNVGNPPAMASLTGWNRPRS